MSEINTEKEKGLNYSRLTEALKYCPITGEFTWQESRAGVKIGKRAGSIKKDGSRKVRLDGKEYLEHRLAWFYIYKEWPKNIIDHINRNKTDNRISNLREVSISENGFNRKDTSEYGPNIYKVHKNFCIQIQLKGTIYRYGTFSLSRAKEVRTWLYEYLDIFGSLPENTEVLVRLFEVCEC